LILIDLIDSGPLPLAALFKVVIVTFEKLPIDPDKVNVVAPFGSSRLQVM